MSRLRLWIGLVALAAVLTTAAAGYWLVYVSNTLQFEGERSLSIPREASFEAATDSLVGAGILKNRFSFTAFATATGWRNQIKAGHYAFESGASNYHLLNALRKGLQTPVRVVIPPGSRPEVVAKVVAKEMAFEFEDFLRALRDSSLAASLGTDTLHLFGYMMPETYFFYWLNDPETVVRKVKQSFDAFYAREREQATLKLELDADDVINVAAIVEWEAHLPEERPRVAGVYLNRLRDNWLLQADPTIQFAIIEREGQKRRLLFRDYEVDHPYNTYAYTGLPPGPVTNPAPTAVKAVLNPEDHGFYFFVATGDGGHIFTSNLRDHNRAASAYYRRLRERNR